MIEAPVIEVQNLTVRFPGPRRSAGFKSDPVTAVDNISFTVQRRETLGLVGESGCGKSTTGLTILNLIKPTSGNISVLGKTMASLSGAERRVMRQRLQIVFQDPYSTLNPRQRVADIIRAPLDIHRLGTPAERRDRVKLLMARVGLRPDQADNYPHQFSGGQRQRIGIARALATQPELVVCDEPVSALDVSVQAQILNLLVELQQEFGLSLLFISHDLSIVKHLSDRVAVMYLGRIVEIAPRATLFAAPRHPYTRLLLNSLPPRHPRERRRQHLGEDAHAPAAPAQPTGGCRFSARCPHVMDVCLHNDPALTSRDVGHAVACHFL
ncbi:MAG: oligopeptide/dipeptide ABC transporter ATP-binding protein [Variovorax sp.]